MNVSDFSPYKYLLVGEALRWRFVILVSIFDCMFFFMLLKNCFSSASNLYQVKWLLFARPNPPFLEKKAAIRNSKSTGTRREMQDAKFCHSLSVQILSKSRTQFLIWLAFNVFWEYWADKQKKICPWGKKLRLTSGEIWNPFIVVSHELLWLNCQNMSYRLGTRLKKKKGIGR